MNTDPVQPTKQGNNSSGSRFQHDLGVLFVHGIGEQPQGDTLVRWGEALIGWIKDVVDEKKDVVDEKKDEKKTAVTVIKASLGSGQTEPAYAELYVTIDGRKSRWLMTEAWWAKAFATPSYGKIAIWCAKVIPWTIAFHFVSHLLSRFRESNKYEDHTSTVVERVWFFLVGAMTFIISMLLSPVLVIILLLLLVFGLIPIPKLREFVRAIQLKLAGSIGDSMILLECPIQSAAIRSRLAEGLQKLKGCKKVAVVAHSQGAAIALDTLSSTELTAKLSYDIAPERVTLITFGSGAQKLQLLRCLTEKGKIRPASHASKNLFSKNRFGLYLRRILNRGRSDPRFLIIWLILLALIAVPICITLLIPWKIFAAIFIQGSYAFIMIVVILEAVIYRISEAETAVRLSMPSSVSNWYDFYSSADPVPNGPIPCDDRARSTKIWNLWSVLRDHTYYWKNREEFVGPVAARLAEIAGTPFKEFGVGEEVFKAGKSRRRNRVGWLHFTRLVVLAAALFFLLSRWYRLADIGRTILKQIDVFLSSIGLTGWAALQRIDSGWVALLTGFTLVACAALLAYGLLRLVWKMWDAHESSNFAHNRGASNWIPFVWVPLVFWVASLAFFAEPAVVYISSHQIAGTTQRPPSGDILKWWLLLLPPFMGLLLAWIVSRWLALGKKRLLAWIVSMGWLALGKKRSARHFEKLLRLTSRHETAFD